tara:strand:- start:2079 stop:2849 length:771 start_codon:yes stop_codon:yes gene_type:complete
MFIRRPARGDRVREIQEALNRLGFGPLEEDGIFGRGTESAIRLFQKSEGLSIDGIVGPNTLTILAKPLPPNDEPKVLQAIRKKGYEVHEDGQCNIIGVRSSQTGANSFDDEIHLVWKSNGWQHKTYACTCDPGTYWLENPTKVEGTAILMPGQYPVYKWDLHRGKYETLCQRAGTVKVWRDANKDNILDHSGDPNEGWFGINIHHAGTDSTNVDKWSAGCQVFKRLADWKEAVDIWRNTGADLFTYTLIDDRDLDS